MAKKPQPATVERATVDPAPYFQKLLDDPELPASHRSRLELLTRRDKLSGYAARKATAVWGSLTGSTRSVLTCRSRTKARYNDDHASP